MANKNKNTKLKSEETLNMALWGASGILFLALILARAIYPELVALTAVIVVLLVAALGGLIVQNQKALKSRKAAFGLNSLVTVLLVIGIVGVLDFLTSRYPVKWDLTKNKVHTLSDQTVKVVKGLSKTVKATYFSKLQQREQVRVLLDNYKALNPKFEVEYVDPDREPTRAKQEGIKRYGTLLLTVGSRENKVEDPTEEKLTNALIKLLKDKNPTLCAITGHGEKSFTSKDAEGYDGVKEALAAQSYDVKEVNLLQETKIPENCDAIALIGPTKSFFEPEVKLIKSYLDNGGRAIVAIDVNFKGPEFAPELIPVLADWHIKPENAMVIDPLSRMLGVDSSVAILATFSKDSPITRDFQGSCAFPFTRPLDIVPGAPAGMNVQWLAETTAKSWVITDLKQIASGEVKIDQTKNKPGPAKAAIAVEGKQKDSKAPRNTRLVVFGSSFFADNNFSRYANNLDFFLNSVSWTMEDESLISIRAKEEGPGKVELSQKAGTFIFLLTVLVIPLVIAVTGIVVWTYRRKL